MEVKVGDELAFKSSGGPYGSYHICKVTKISPTGRITCGSYTLNPDLSVRGRNSWNSPFRAEPVTVAIRRRIRHDELCYKLNSRVKWAELDLETLEQVYAVLLTAKERNATSNGQAHVG